MRRTRSNPIVDWLKIIFGGLFILAAIPAAFYVTVVWGWYEGLVLVFNSVMTSPSATSFAWGAVKIIAGSTFGAIAGWFSFFIGAAIWSTL